MSQIGRPPAAATALEPRERRAIISWIARAAVGAVGYAAMIFLPAGRLDWVWGWVLLAVMAAVLAAHPLILLPVNPKLLAERSKGTLAQGVKPWDKAITTAAGALMLLSWVVGGLDLRFGWSPPAPLGWHLAGLVEMVLGYGLFMWAMAANAFFAEGVRIQTERGHTVATGGPYRVIRHPGYLGAITAQLGTPLLLGSPWALLPAGLLAVLFVLRTHLEDSTLLAELPGYADYAGCTRFRLVPGVW